jgi:ribonuclease HII
MKQPNFQEEKKLWKKGYKKIVGIDEAGRGPLAGPVVACALVIKNCSKFDFKQIKDSKKLSPKRREELYKTLIKHPAIEWGIGRVSEKVIDRINILEATKLAMKKAVQKLKKPSFLVLDGKIALDLETPQKSIVKADEKVFSCACASIIAKVTRDKLMQKCDKKYPFYGFGKHKGYPTKLHRKMLRKHGPCKIHRKSFKPVKNY